MKVLIVSLAVLGGSSGCSSSPSELTSRTHTEVNADGALSGYSHRFNQSRFAIGSPTTTRSEFGMQKVEGPWGVFATDDVTGMVIALPNATAPSRSAPPFPGGPDAQNAAVKNYFLGAGLPAGQIASVMTMGKVSASGIGVPDGPPAFKPGSSYSYITRQFSGIRIVDSYACARMNANGEIVNEYTYWPAIPATVLADASGFATKLADGNWKAGFLAKLPSPQNGELVIRHSQGTSTASFSATVSYDVPAPGRLRHFNQAGVSFDLPGENSAPAANYPNPSK